MFYGRWLHGLKVPFTLGHRCYRAVIRGNGGYIGYLRGTSAMSDVGFGGVYRYMCL